MSTSSMFYKNILTLMAGTTVAQIIPIAISPILTRIYTPEDFGVFALYVSIVSLLAGFVSGKYELAIVLAKNKKEAINIFALAFLLTSFVSVFLLVIVFIFHDEIVNLLGLSRASLLYLIPVTIFMTGVYQIFNYWYIRKKEYQRITVNKVLQSSFASSSVVFSWISSSGMIFGHLLGQILAIVSYFLYFFRVDFSLLKQVEKREVFMCAVKHKSFPMYTMFHSFLNTLSTNFPILLLNYFFNLASAGLYSLAERILSAPIGIVSSSYSQVFFQEVSDMKKENMATEEIKLVFKKTILKLVFLFSPLVVIFLLIAPDVFSFVFGEKWRAAGVYSQILLPMLFVRFLGRTVSSLVVIYEQQLKGFIFEVVNMSFSFFGLLVGVMNNNFIVGLVLFSVLRTFVSIARLYWYSRIII